MAHLRQGFRATRHQQGELVAGKQKQRDQQDPGHEGKAMGAGEYGTGFGGTLPAKVAGEQARHAARHQRRNRDDEHVDGKHQRDGGQGRGADIDTQEQGVGHGQQTVHAHHEDDRQCGPGIGPAERIFQKDVGWGFRHIPVLLSHGSRRKGWGPHYHPRETRGGRRRETSGRTSPGRKVSGRRASAAASSCSDRWPAGQERRAGAVDHQGAKVSIAPFADPEQPGLAAARLLSGHQP